MTEQKLAYSIQAVAKMISVSPYVVRTALKSGELKHARLGHRVLITHDQLAAWLASKTQETLK